VRLSIHTLLVFDGSALTPEEEEGARFKLTFLKEASIEDPILPKHSVSGGASANLAYAEQWVYHLACTCL